MKQWKRVCGMLVVICLLVSYIPATVSAAGANGWQLENGKWYYYENGTKVTNDWRKDSKGWCYLTEDGTMATNAWIMDSVGWCYVGADGYCVTDEWVADSYGWCYLDSEGRMATNRWIMDSVGWCYVGSNGYCVTDKWVKDSVGWCYLDSNGRMATNRWVMDSVGWCYVGPDGYAVTDCWMRDSVGWCYLDSEGSMKKSAWIDYEGDRYYVDDEGYMVTGEYEIDGVVHLFDENGVWLGEQAPSENKCGDNAYWKLDEDGVLYITGTGKMWDADYAYPQWLEQSDKIKKVVFAEGITYVGSQAFTYCWNLSSVTFADSITEIGKFAFWECNNLASFDLPAQLQTLGQHAFSYTSIESVVIPETVVFYDLAFAYCTNLKSVRFKSDPNLTSFTISNCPFDGCTALEEIVVDPGHITLRSHEGVLYSEDALLQYPSGKKDKSYAILDGTKNLSLNCGRYAAYLENLIIPESVTSIGEYAFEYCPNLQSVTLGGSGCEIGDYAFRYCDQLSEVVLREGTKAIGKQAFCFAALSEVYIPASVETLGEKSFGYTDGSGGTIVKVPDFVIKGHAGSAAEAYAAKYGFTFVDVDASAEGLCGDNAYWKLDEDGVLYITGTGAMWDTDYVYPQWLEQSDKIKKVVFAEGITYVGSGAFTDCLNLSSVTFADSIVGIGELAFAYCYSLTSIDLPARLQTLDFNAFFYAGIESVVIPKTVTSLDLAFAYCYQLKYVRFESDPNLPSCMITMYPFLGCTALEEIVVDSGHITLRSHEGLLYSGDTLLQYPLGKKDKSYTIPDGTYTIYPQCARGAQYLENLIIPESVTRIHEYAFYDCPNLQTVTLGGSGCEIGDYAFRYCDQLSEVVLREGTKAIGKQAFCFAALTEVYIPASVETLGEKSFGYTDGSGGSIVKVPGFVIKGHAGTAAEAYAKSNGFDFVIVN